MSASTETSFRRVSSPSTGVGFAGLLAALAPRLRFASRHQRVGAITVWDGQARFQLPAPGSCFRLGLYVTFRRGPDDEGPESDPPPAAAARPPAVAEECSE